MSVREVQVHWYEPTRLRCRPHHVLRIAGVRPLDRSRSPAADAAGGGDGDCGGALRALATQLNASCQGRPHCVMDAGAVNAIRASCRHVRYINVDVYCEPRASQTHHLHCAPCSVSGSVHTGSAVPRYAPCGTHRIRCERNLTRFISKQRLLILSGWIFVIRNV